jgi:hypothetical protein
MDCSNSDDEYDYNKMDYANCEDTMSINHFSSYRSYPHTYRKDADMIRLEQVRQKKIHKEQLEKIQKEKESLELSFKQLSISKHV